MSRKDDFLEDVVKQSTTQPKTKKNSEVSDSDQDLIGSKLKQKYAEKKTNRMLQTVSIRIPMNLYDKLNKKAKEHDVSIGTLSRDLLEMSVDQI